MKTHDRLTYIVAFVCVFIFSNVILILIDHQNKYEEINSCPELFGIGHSSLDDHRLNSAAINLFKSKLNNTQETEDYNPFLKYIPNLIVREEGILKFQDKTRLEILNGQLPYLGCKAHLYSEMDIQKCLQIRRNSQKETHIAFLGDSKMRFAAEHFVFKTKHFLQWSPDILHLLSKRDEDRKPEHSTWTAKTDIGFNIQYIFAPHGANELNDTGYETLEELESWTNGTITPPTVVVMDYGLTEMISYQETLLNRLENVYDRWKANRDLIKKLSTKSVVLILAQSRSRESNAMFLLDNERKGISMLSTAQGKMAQHAIGHSLTTPYSEIIDRIKVHYAESLGITFWDTTLPFNLLSDKECELIVKYNTSILYREFVEHKGYRRYMCHDDVHRTEPTIKDEMTMLWNLICNKYLPQKKGTCCQ